MPILLGDGIGAVLSRPIPGTSLRDVLYPYPMFALLDEPQLLGALRALSAGGIVTATFVTDPLHGIAPNPSEWNLARPWKDHLVVDNSIPGACSFSSKVRYYSNRASSKFGLRVEFVEEDRARFLGTWLDLWGCLVGRHDLRGLKALSPNYFKTLFELKEVLLAVLSDSEEIHSIHIWILDGDRCYSHLHASDDQAYSASGNYLLYSAALSWMRDRGFRVCLLGSSSGAGTDDGLFQFKKQFANSSAGNFLLGCITDGQAYGEMTGSTSYAGGYFPAYREGELL